MAGDDDPEHDQLRGGAYRILFLGPFPCGRLVRGFR